MALRPILIGEGQAAPLGAAKSFRSSRLMLKGGVPISRHLLAAPSRRAADEACKDLLPRLGLLLLRGGLKRLPPSFRRGN